jgi:putative transposase
MPHEDILLKKRFSDEQIISIFREVAAGVAARELGRKHAISDAMFHTWKKVWWHGGARG